MSEYDIDQTIVEYKKEVERMLDAMREVLLKNPMKDGEDYTGTVKLAEHKYAVLSASIVEL